LSSNRSTWSAQEIPDLVRAPKLYRTPLPRPQEANNAKFLVISFDFLYSDGTTFPGIWGEIQWRPNQAETNCNEKLTLIALIDGSATRIFQIEIYPFDRLTHRDSESGQRTYGPHLRYNETTRRCSARFACGEANRACWFSRFARHIHAMPAHGHYEQLTIFGDTPW